MKMQSAIEKNESEHVSTPSRSLQLNSRAFADSSTPIQAKLTIGEPNDKYEQEADRVAAQVVQKINSPQEIQRQEENEDELQMKPLASSIQRQEEEDEELQMKPILQREGGIVSGDASSDLESSINRARGSGQALDTGLQRSMGQAMGADFSRVKIHTDGESDRLNQSIQAKAFTTGQDLFFKKGEYSPGTKGGQELIAHELTHVVQQSGASVLQPKIQRSQDDNLPDRIANVMSFATFKKNTYCTFSKRGEFLEVIDRWLQALHASKTWTEQQYNLAQVTDACQVWLNKYGINPLANESSSYTYRRSTIKDLLSTTWRAPQAQAPQAQSPQTQSPQTTATVEKEEGNGSDEALSVSDGIGNALSGLSGGSGDFDDTNSTEHGQAIGSDLIGGVEAVNGVSSIVGAVKQFRDENSDTGKKVEAVGNGTTGLAKIGQGITSVVKFANDSDRTGELGAVIGDGVSVFSGTITTVNNLIDLCKNCRTSTWKENVSAGLEVINNGASTGQAGVKTALGAIKTQQAFSGATVSGATGVASAAAILGIITGSIQIVQGGFSIYRGWSGNRAIDNVEKKQAEIIQSVNNTISQVAQQLPALAGNQTEMDKVIVEIDKLKTSLEKMKEFQLQAAPAMAAVRKIQNQRMKDGAMKMTGGTLSVVSSALVLSGVGAPIAIAIGALGGLIALGSAGVSLARNSKAGDLTAIATRLDDQGKAKAKSDPEPPSYRIMEGRIYKCYYSNLPKVITKTTPSGLSESQFKLVKQFTWEDKKSRVRSMDKQIIRQPDEASNANETIKRSKWFEVQDGNNKPTHKEKPKGWTKVDLFFSSSAHKSKQAMQASKGELATILTQMCMQSYNPATKNFVESPVNPIGGGEDELKEFKAITLTGLLKGADINAAKWTKWLGEVTTPTCSTPDAIALGMKKKILTHLG